MKMWEAKGYAGFHDYDSKEDYNFRHVSHSDFAIQGV